MTATVDERRRQLHAPIAAPFTPEQEARVREIVRAHVCSSSHLPQNQPVRTGEVAAAGFLLNGSPYWPARGRG